MTFKKGGKLKLSSKKKALLGSKHSMEARRSNDPNRLLKCVESKRDNINSVVERESPHLQVSDAWAPGDVVEVFENFSWKMATVSEVLGKTYILVRLLGSSQGFKVKKSDIRARQPWDMVGRANNDCKGVKLHTNLILNQRLNSVSQVQKTNSRKSLLEKDDHSATWDRGLQDIHNTKVRILKRSTNHSSEAIDGARHKVRVIENKGRYLRIIAENPSELPAEVGDVTYHRDFPSLSRSSESLNLELGGHLEVDIRGKKPTIYIRESNDVDSITCSVGSCSISGGDLCELPDDVSAGQMGREGNSPPPSEALAAEIHRLELRAYRCTIEALHASGPLSWDQEVLITNLRLSLNISNDEHLMQLKHLISADTSIPIN